MGAWVLPQVTLAGADGCSNSLLTRTQTQVSGIAPSPRGGNACVTVGTQVVVFGGSDRAPLTFDDLWVLETANGQFEWTKVSPSYDPGCQVMPRSGATLTVVRDRIYLYGGQEPVTEHRFSDIKCLDPDCWRWSDVPAQGTIPPARHSHSTGCLAKQCLLIYGGSGAQGTLSDLWVFNVETSAWSHITTHGTVPPAREMHSGCMVDDTTMLVYGGRSADGRILCDAALLDASSMTWTAAEPTPFSRCAHSGVLLASRSTKEEDAESSGRSGCFVIIYGGFSGEAVEGDVLQIDTKTLEIELVRRGPREADPPGTVPQPRFAHAASCIAWPGSEGKQAMVVVGGVNPAEDLNDVAVWVPS